MTRKATRLLSALQPHWLVSITVVAMLLSIPAQARREVPAPPSPERIAVTELPLPPALSSNSTGACTRQINPHRTGCIATAPLSIQSGSFLPDDHHVLVQVTFVGAPAAPDPASIYSGSQIIVVKADGTMFSNGDPWNCITCGVPAKNARGASPTRDYPQAFIDGKRILAGTNIIDCSPLMLTDDRCTAEHVHIYPIRWNTSADGTGRGGTMRELRLNPDNVHLGFNSFSFSNGRLGQQAYIGRLVFNPAPKKGDPRVPRYELTHVIGLYRQKPDNEFLAIDPRHPHELKINHQAIDVGEFRGFSKDGREILYIGPPFESCNIDLFAADLETGKVRRLTSDPGYTDPVDASPDDKWIVVEDTRGSRRQMFLAAMRGVPPLTDLVSTAAVASVRNNHERRFFQPFLIDRYGDRGDYDGQQLNAGSGKPGSASDPNWNAMADPRWSFDGTRVVYWQAQVASPACGGSNPLPCPEATEPGGRRFRVMVAHFLDRKPLLFRTVKPIPDEVPWGTPYVPGSPTPSAMLIPEGTYTLRGKVSGIATVKITQTPTHNAIAAVDVSYKDYSDVKGTVLNGTESVEETSSRPVVSSLVWHSNLVQSGKTHGTKKTSPGGFRLTINVMENVFHAEGTLTTTINGKVYRQPGNGD